MYPLGLLFGLGFDTAAEGRNARARRRRRDPRGPVPGHDRAPAAVRSGDEPDRHRRRSSDESRYGWAFSNPVRRIFYNLAVTSVSVAVALTVGTIELLQVGARTLALKGGFWGFVASLDFNRIGYGVAAVFVLAWLASAMLWKAAHLERRWKASFD